MHFEEDWKEVSEGGIQVIREYLETGKTRHPPILNPDGSVKTILFTNEEHSRLYTIVYSLATNRDTCSPELFARYISATVSWLVEQVRPTVDRSAFSSDVEFLKSVAKRWEDHKLWIKCMHRFFLYLDRFYLKLSSHDSLEKTALKLWEKHIYKPISHDLFRAILDLVEQDRNVWCSTPVERSGTGRDFLYTSAIDADLIRSVTQMIQALSDFTPIYHEVVRPMVLKHASDFYTQMASLWISTLTFPEYLKKTEQALASEEARCKTYFFKSESAVLQKALLESLLVHPQKQLLAMPTAIEYLLQSGAKDDLHRAFCLFGKCEKGLQPMANAFRLYVEAEGQRLIKAKSDAISAKGKNISKTAFASLTRNPDVADLEFVYSLLQLHQKFKQYVEEVFSLGGSASKEFNFSRALKNAFESFMNQDVGGYPMAAFICTYADKLIRRPANTDIPLPATQDAMEAEIRKLVELFTYLTDKDLFAEGYRQQLARRLIGAPGLPHEAEKYLIARLKEECGNSFSCKLEGMLADSAETQEPREAFAAFLRQKGLSEPQLSFNVQVLTTGHWPSYPPTPMILPPVIEEGIDRFKEWYDTRTKNRKLTWINSLAQAIVAANFTRPHDLVCTGFQATLLLLFNDEEKGGARSRTLKDLAEGSGLQDSNLKKQVKCLYGKFPIVLKEENGEDIENPIFRVNLEFTYPARRFKLPVPLQEEGQQKDNITQDRSIAIEAAIVRVMKTRKELTHSRLVSEVLSHLSLFKPQLQDIKKCIEGLLAREFLARDEVRGNVYTYLA